MFSLLLKVVREVESLGFYLGQGLILHDCVLSSEVVDCINHVLIDLVPLFFIKRCRLLGGLLVGEVVLHGERMLKLSDLVLSAKRVVLEFEEVVLVFLPDLQRRFNCLLEVEFLFDVVFHVLAEGRTIYLVVGGYFGEFIEMTAVQVIGASCGVESGHAFRGRNAPALAATQVY